MLGDSIGSQHDMALIHEVAEERGFGGADLVPDAVIVGTAVARDSHGVAAAWSQWPETPVLIVTLDGHHAVLYELDIHITELGERSPDELVDVIRAVVNRRGQSKRKG